MAIERRFRRRRQLAILLTIAVVVAVIALAVRYRTEQRETSEYLALADEIAKTELTVSEGLRGLFGALADLDRPDIIERIDTLTTQAREMEAMLDAAVVTRPAAEIHGFLAVAVQSWAEGLDGLDDAVIEIMDAPEDVEDPSAPLAHSIGQLRLGDDAYAGFLDAVPAMDTDIEPPAYPEVVFLPDAGDTEVDAAALRLGLTASLKETRDVAVTVNTVPEPTGDRNGLPVMPFVPTVDADVVVTNAGNVTQDGIEVMFELVPDGEEAVVESEQRIIPSLDPGSSMALEFIGFPIEAGGFYTLRVTASIAEDAQPDDNVWELAFAVNDQ